jgi:hypothetical protein
MKLPTLRMTGFLPLSGLAIVWAVPIVWAAPNIPASDLPGRERQRFESAPVERFMQPGQKSEPLIRWQCDTRKSQAKKKKRAKQGEC